MNVYTCKTTDPLSFWLQRHIDHFRTLSLEFKAFCVDVGIPVVLNTLIVSYLKVEVAPLSSGSSLVWISPQFLVTTHIKRPESPTYQIVRIDQWHHKEGYQQFFVPIIHHQLYSAQTAGPKHHRLWFVEVEDSYLFYFGGGPYPFCTSPYGFIPFIIGSSQPMRRVEYERSHIKSLL